MLAAMAAVALGAFSQVGNTTEPRRDPPWGDWIYADCDYDEALVRTIGPDRSDSWGYVGELTSGVGPGYSCYNSRTPMALDYRTDDGKVVPGIFRYEGSLLVCCYSLNREPFNSRGQYDSRPTEFVSNAENRYRIEILRPAGEFEAQLGTARQDPDSEESPFAGISKEWRVISHRENEETTVPNGQAAWLIRMPWRVSRDYHPGDVNALSYGPMMFTTNPSWLDEVRVVEGPKGPEQEIRRGLCRRAGDSFHWIVASKWESPYWSNQSEKETRPVSFRATKENGHILRVIYPADLMK